jgi:hypothetical protein
VLGYGIALGIVDLPPHIIDGGIDNNPPDPANQQHFHFIFIPDLKTAEIPEHLKIRIMCHLGGLLVRIDVPEGYFDA